MTIRNTDRHRCKPITSLDLPDDYDDMTIEIEKERYVYVSRFMGRCVRKRVLVRWKYRHTVIDSRKSCLLSKISHDGTWMTMPVGTHLGPSCLRRLS
jgi:hypothetical protein